MRSQTEALPSSQDISPGSVLAGKYRVDRVLGAGGMGMVLAARHLQLDQKVAVKLLLPHALRNPEIVARFDQEARATVRIQSEHVVKVLDVGRENGSPYMVMEYLEGNDLAATLKARGPLPLADAVTYVLQACEALAEAHKLGIVHRDLKPANLFLTTRADGSPLVKVLDFGISKASLANSVGPAGGLTQDASVMGSPNYMSPEQLRNSKDVDARADIWSMGLVLYELLTGLVAFQADTIAELHVAILQSFPSSLLGRRPDLPNALEMVVLRCLHKDRNFRYASIAELAQDLGEFAPPSAQVSIERICRLLGVARTASAPSSQASSPAVSWGAPPQPGPFPTHASTYSQAPQSSYAQPPSSVGAPPPTTGYGSAPAPTPWPPPPAQAPVVPYNPPQATGPWSPPGAPTWTPPHAPPLAPVRSGPPVAGIMIAIIVGVLVLGSAGCVACVALFGIR